MVLLLVVAELDFLVLSLSERLTGCNFYLLIIIGSFFFGWSSAIQSNGLCPNGEDQEDFALQSLLPTRAPVSLSCCVGATALAGSCRIPIGGRQTILPHLVLPETGFRANKRGDSPTRLAHRGCFSCKSSQHSKTEYCPPLKNSESNNLTYRECSNRQVGCRSLWVSPTSCCPSGPPKCSRNYSGPIFPLLEILVFLESSWGWSRI